MHLCVYVYVCVDCASKHPERYSEVYPELFEDAGVSSSTETIEGSHSEEGEDHDAVAAPS